MTPEKHFERYATAIAHDMEASQTPFLLAIRPNVTENPKFFVCAGLGNDIDHANMIAKFTKKYCEESGTSIDVMRKLIDEAFAAMCGKVNDE